MMLTVGGLEINNLDDAQVDIVDTQPNDRLQIIASVIYTENPGRVDLRVIELVLDETGTSATGTLELKEDESELIKEIKFVRTPSPRTRS